MCTTRLYILGPCGLSQYGLYIFYTHIHTHTRIYVCMFRSHVGSGVGGLGATILPLARGEFSFTEGVDGLDVFALPAEDQATKLASQVA